MDEIWIEDNTNALINLLFAMDPTKASYARYWDPSLIQTFSLSMVAGAIATAATYPMDYIKTIAQFRSEAVGLRGDRWKRKHYL